MAQDLRCLQIQLFASLVVKELITGAGSDHFNGAVRTISVNHYHPKVNENSTCFAAISWKGIDSYYFQFVTTPTHFQKYETELSLLNVIRQHVVVLLMVKFHGYVVCGVSMKLQLNPSRGITHEV